MRIVLVSDTHLARRARAFGDNWALVRGFIAAERPDLVIHLGDISADGIGDPADLDEAATEFAGMGEIRFLPGNHDIGDNPLADGGQHGQPVAPDRLRRYRALFGADRWSFAAAGWQLIGLNAQLFNTGTAEEAAQLDWLERALAAGRGPLGVMLHKPLFRHGPGDTEAHVRYVPAEPRQRLLALLAARDLRFVASGHAHQARHIEVDGVQHVWVPSTAFCIPEALQETIGEKRVGIVRLDLSAECHRFAGVTPPGLVRYNLLDHPQVYAPVAELRARLGARAAL